jgi:inhibitor of cysteine peptidase
MIAFKNLRPLVTAENRKLYWAFAVVAGSWMISLSISGVYWLVRHWSTAPVEVVQSTAVTFEQFGSESAFRQYLQSQQQRSADNFFGGDGLMPQGEAAFGRPVELPKSRLETGPQDQTFSQTNVQVIGIDEPDVMKTNGREIFYSQIRPFVGLERRLPVDDILPAGRLPWPGGGSTKVVSAQTPAAVRLAAAIPEGGELLLTEDTLVILGNQSISGFDILNPDAPVQRWAHSLEGNQNLVTSRLKDGAVYLITQTYTSAHAPCPMPVLAGDTTLKIACDQIYYWPVANQALERFTVIKLNARTGQVEQQVAFMGNGGFTTVYMAASYLYIGHYIRESEASLLPQFIPHLPEALMDVETRDKIANTSRLLISDPAKEVEYQQILAEYSARFSDDERLLWQTEFGNLFSEYRLRHARAIERTALSKIDLNTLTIQAGGTIPGKLLNQFSLDEFDGHLRAAVTVGDLWEVGLKSVNDVYVLNDQLAVLGEVIDLGRDERIYSVRFVGERGYVVTFRETDPFYVLDLARPEAPAVAGELKIPGYSSYLHPLSETLILGVGREENKVKLGLYNVADPARPVEQAKYLLDEYWSEAVDNHRAFLHNRQTNTFFIPGGKGGYFFTWSPEELRLSHALAQTNIRRAVYIDDVWHLGHEQGLLSVQAETWRRVNSLSW